LFQDFQTQYSGFWIRFVAYIIDFIIQATVFCPLGFIVGAVGAATENENSAPMAAANLLLNVVSIVVGWLYFAFLESSSWQGTVGKKLLGIRVTDLYGNRISFGRATGRYFGKLVSGMICAIGFFMIAFTEKKQGLHDMLASTLVLKGAATGMGISPPPPPSEYGYNPGPFGGMPPR
jgi:uncharacterized RDD family membrane protein YckC